MLTSARSRVAFTLGFSLSVVALCGMRLWSMVEAGQVLVGDEARTAVDALSAHELPQLGVPTTSSEYIDRTLANPGPALLFGLYPFVTTLGTDLGSWVFALAVGLGSVAVAGYAAARQEGAWAGLIVVCSMLLMAFTTNPGGMTHSLNTEVVLLPAFGCIVLAWAVASGDSAMLPVLAAVSTFVVQTFVGIAPVVFLPCLAAAVMLGRQWRSSSTAEHWDAGLGAHVAIAGTVLAVMWLLPVVDQLWGTGNLGGLLGFRTTGRGLDGVVAASAASLDPFRLSLGVSTLDPPGLAVLVTLAAIAAIVCTKLGRQSAWGLRDLVLIVGCAGLGSAAVTFVSPPTDTATYHFFHVGIIRYAVLMLLALVIRRMIASWRLHGDVPASGSSWAPLGVAAAAALLVAVVGLNAEGGHRVDQRRSSEMAAVLDLTRELEARLPRDQPVQILSRSGSSFGNVAQGIVAQLRSRGRSGVTTGFVPLVEGQRVVVVTTPSIATSSGGEVLGASGPSVVGAESGLPERLLSWARVQSRLVLTPSGADNLVDRIDGSESVLCVPELEADPSLLLDLPPSVAARMFASGEIAEPRPEGRLGEDLQQWWASEGFALLELPANGAWRSRLKYQQLLLSHPRCPT